LQLQLFVPSCPLGLTSGPHPLLQAGVPAVHVVILSCNPAAHAPVPLLLPPLLDPELLLDPEPLLDPELLPPELLFELEPLLEPDPAPELEPALDPEPLLEPVPPLEPAGPPELVEPEPLEAPELPPPSEPLLASRPLSPLSSKPVDWAIPAHPTTPRLAASTIARQAELMEAFIGTPGAGRQPSCGRAHARFNSRSRARNCLRARRKRQVAT
jgi:hypothetical protein